MLHGSCELQGGFLATLVSAACLFGGGRARAETVVVDDPLNGSSTGSVSGGEFLSGGEAFHEAFLHADLLAGDARGLAGGDGPEVDE
jgi:hypothetical protein